MKLKQALAGVAIAAASITGTVLVTNQSAPAPSNRTYDLPRRSTTGGAQKEVYITQQGTIQPGDTLELSGTYTWIKVQNVSGTPDKHVVLRAKSATTIGGGPYAGISLNGSYIDILGANITINHPSTPNEGIRLDLSDHNEISGVKMNNVTVGIIQNPTGGKVIEGQYFHHLTITNMANPAHGGRAEGFYLGATSGVSATFKDARIEDNELGNLSGDGIQAGSGNFSIKRNVIIKYGQADLQYQNSGIEIGGNGSGVIEGNSITYGKGTAIKVMGNGTVSVINNLIAYNTTTRPTEDLIYIGGKGGKLFTLLQDNEFGNNTPARKWVYNNNDAATDGGIVYKGNKGLIESGLLKKAGDQFAAYVAPVVTPPVVTPPVVVPPTPTKKVTKVITVYDDGSVELK